jgi:subtilisin family serine protease
VGRGVLLLFLLLVACAFLALRSTTLATPHADPDTKILAGVSEAVEQSGQARVIVALNATDSGSTDPGQLRKAAADGQERALAALDASDFLTVRRYQGVPALAGYVSKDGLQALIESPAVAEISPDVEGMEALSESVPLIHADDVHQVGVTGDGIVVAVLDSGIDTDHPDLADDIAYESCFLSTAMCPPQPHPAEDNGGHGTAVAGVITSNGNLGVAPDAMIAAYRVTDPTSFASDWIAALDDIIVNHPEVDAVNMSLVSVIPCPLQALSDAIGTLRDMGIPTFIAAGNFGDKHNLLLPACIPEAISVGAVQDFNDPVTGVVIDSVPAWSSSDDSLDLLAPGTVIDTTTLGGGVSWAAGTSFAAPHAAGVAALLFQVAPDLSVDELEAMMEQGGTPVTDDLADGDPETSRTTPRVDARVALLGDEDGDGCTKVAEEQTDPGSEFFGGRRDPQNFWDFFDPSRNKAITIGDLHGVLRRFGARGDPQIDPLSVAPPPPNYHTLYDRGLAGGPNPLNLTAANGSISTSDIFALLVQFGHRCA